MIDDSETLTDFLVNSLLGLELSISSTIDCLIIDLVGVVPPNNNNLCLFGYLIFSEIIEMLAMALIRSHFNSISSHPFWEAPFA